MCSGSLEGKRNKLEYEKLLEDPMIKYSGLYQENNNQLAELLVECEVFASGKSLALPVHTCYKSFSNRWKYVRSF
jgi:phosphatidylinositol 3-kinase